MYTSDKRVCLDASGNVVDCDSEAAATLLVGQGGQLSDEDARKYGLVADQEPAADQEPDAKAQAPAANKARTPAENK